MSGFATEIEVLEDGTLAGPLRYPRQMLQEQAAGNAAGDTIHDDATAQKLGFKGGTIEGPTHFTQFEPLAEQLWDEEWRRTGCISAHYRSPVFEGEGVRALLSPAGDGARHGTIRMEKEDGTEVLLGSISVGSDAPPSALAQRLAGLDALDRPVLMHDVEVGMTTRPVTVTMAPDTHMGALYPFTLRQKLEAITEKSARFATDIPMEMISVLANSISLQATFPVKRPSIGLFADQEIQLLRGPLEIGRAYDITREVVALTGSRKTESMWIEFTIRPAGESEPAARILLNMATLKGSYAAYDEEAARLYTEEAG